MIVTMNQCYSGSQIAFLSLKSSFNQLIVAALCNLVNYESDFHPARKAPVLCCSDVSESADSNAKEEVGQEE